MTAEQARCTNHPESKAESHCPRCGSFVCSDCLPDSCPSVCIPCRAQLKLETDSIYLSCLSCENPMELGYVSPISPLAFLPLAKFKKFLTLAQHLSTYYLTFPQWFSLLLKELTTWGNSWLRIDRCAGCRHVLIDFGHYYFTGEVKKRRKAGEEAHKTPWRSTGECPRCQQRLTVAYLARRAPTIFRSFEDFDRLIFRGYKALLVDGVPLGERIEKQFKPSHFFNQVHHAIYRCEQCRVAVLCYREAHSVFGIKALSKEAEDYRKALAP